MLLPRTRAGRGAVALLAAFVVALLVFAGLIGSGQRGGETFFSNPWLAAAGLAVAAGAIGAGILGVVAVVAERERNGIVILAVVVGTLVALWVGLELAFPHALVHGSPWRTV